MVFIINKTYALLLDSEKSDEHEPMNVLILQWCLFITVVLKYFT